VTRARYAARTLRLARVAFDVDMLDMTLDARFIRLDLGDGESRPVSSAKSIGRDVYSLSSFFLSRL